MNKDKRDKTKVDPLTAGEEPKAPRVYREAAEKGGPVNAETAEIPGTGKIIKDRDGNEAGRNVGT